MITALDCHYTATTHRPLTESAMHPFVKGGAKSGQRAEQNKATRAA
jgi:hypothetical protein